MRGPGCVCWAWAAWWEPTSCSAGSKASVSPPPPQRDPNREHMRRVEVARFDGLVPSLTSPPPPPRPPGEQKLFGDLLVLGGATLYGISNVCEEFIVKNQSRVEFLGMMGLFGSFFSGIQL